MFYVQSISLKIADRETLKNKKLLERTCLLSASCANICSNNLTFSGEVGQSYSYNFMSDKVCFAVSVHPTLNNILISLHSFVGHEPLNKIVDHFVKIYDPELECSNFQEFTFS